MKKTYSIRIEEETYNKIVKLGGNFIKGLDKLLNNQNEEPVGYSEFKEALQLFIEVAKKFKPDPHTIIEEAKLREATLKKLQSGAGCTKSKAELWKDIETQVSKAEKTVQLQSIADGVKPDATPVMDHPLRTAKDYQDAKLLAGKIKIGIKKNHGKMQDNDGFDCTWQKRISFEGCSHLESLIETMI